MKKGKVARLAGFAGALGLTTVLVTTAVQGTGAYFTSETGGQLTGTTGHLTVQAQNTTLNFSNLVPGVDKTQKVSFNTTAGSATNSDIWLVFDSNSAAYGAFTGAKDPSGKAYVTNGTAVTDGGLGQYGHFAVTGQSGIGFESYNLQLPSVSDAMQGYSSSTARNTCTVTDNGDGGSNVQHVVGGGTDIAECGVPAAILVWKNLAPGAMGASATIKFGVTGDMTAMDSPQVNLPFKIVATQVGQYPLIQPGTKAATKNPASVGTVGSNW
ncbi:MAG: hypothetical protein J0I11_09025 [Actinobacteria bacterium]|nr:hypothetical protein [Actinomycetota bacterium]